MACRPSWFGDGRRVRLVPRETIGAGFVQRHQRCALAAGVFGAHGFVFGDDFGHVAVALVGGQQLGGDADGARGIRHVDHGTFGVGGDLDRGMGAAGRRAADQQRLLHVQALHFAGDVGHFFERGRDQAGQADDVDAMLERGFQDVVAGDHDAEVDDVVAVAAEDDADDVLADVVHVALDRGHQDLALAAQAGAGLFRFDVGQQVGDRLLHDAGRFDHLRQEHLAGAEQVADVVHAVHQRAFDDGERRLAFGFELGAHFFGVGHDEIGDALDQRMFQALFDGLFTPAQVRPAVLGLAFLHRLGEIDQRLAGARIAVEHHVLDLLRAVPAPDRRRCRACRH